MKKAGPRWVARADGSVGVSDDETRVMKRAVPWNHDAHVLAFRRRERARRDFDEHYWPVGRAIRWIVECERARARVALEKLGADIDPDVRIQSLTPIPDEPEAAHVWTELVHRTSAFAAKYDYWRGPENEQQLVATRLLLNAIQAGRIQPIDENGGIMPREKWAHATPGDWPDVRMLRDEILKEFPAEPLSAFPANVSGHAATTSAAATSEVPPPPRRKRSATKSPAAEAALRQLYPSGPSPSPDRKAIHRAVEDKMGTTVSVTTVDRARAKLWPPAQ